MINLDDRSRPTATRTQSAARRDEASDRRGALRSWQDVLLPLVLLLALSFWAFATR